MNRKKIGEAALPEPSRRSSLGGSDNLYIYFGSSFASSQRKDMSIRKEILKGRKRIASLRDQIRNIDRVLTNFVMDGDFTEHPEIKEQREKLSIQYKELNRCLNRYRVSLFRFGNAVARTEYVVRQGFQPKGGEQSNEQSERTPNQDTHVYGDRTNLNQNNMLLKKD